MEYKRNKKLFKQRVQLLLAAITIMTIHLYFLLYNVSIALDNQHPALLRPPTTNSSLQQQQQQQQHLLDGSSRSWAQRHFQEVGISLDNDTLSELPTNYEIIHLFGKEPLVVMGTSKILSRVEANSYSNKNDNRHLDNDEQEQCNNFYKRVPNPKDRWIGVAGFFNTGTNLLYQLLKANCVMPKNNAVYWQVPWGKHAFATLSRNQTAKGLGNVIKDNGLAIVATRNPYACMCKHPYVIKWEYTEHCPSASFKVLSWGGHSNLYTFYNSYYSKYWKEFHYPKIFVRLEDMTLRPQSTISKVCNCAGGRMTAKFKHVTDSAKKGHKSTTDMIKAWKSVVASNNEINGGLLHIKEYTIAKQALDDGGLMKLFGYKHPPPSSSSRPYQRNE